MRFNILLVFDLIKIKQIVASIKHKFMPATILIVKNSKQIYLIILLFSDHIPD
mgnify:CR=1 FL=1